VQCVEDATINEDVLLCKPIKKRAPAKELFKIGDDFMGGKSIKWSDYDGLCTDATCIIAGNKGLQVLINDQQ
jgi:hypothetical protein